MIKDIQFIPVKPDRGLVGFASFTFDDKFYFSSIAVYTKRDGSGYRLVYPGKKFPRGLLYYYNPLTPELSAQIEADIFVFVEEFFKEGSDE